MDVSIPVEIYSLADLPDGAAAFSRSVTIDGDVTGAVRVRVRARIGSTIGLFPALEVWLVPWSDAPANDEAVIPAPRPMRGRILGVISPVGHTYDAVLTAVDVPGIARIAIVNRSGGDLSADRDLLSVTIEAWRAGT